MGLFAYFPCLALRTYPYLLVFRVLVETPEQQTSPFGVQLQPHYMALLYCSPHVGEHAVRKHSLDGPHLQRTLPSPSILDGVLQVANSVMDVVMAPDIFKVLVSELFELWTLFVGLSSQLDELLNAARLDNV